MIQGQFGMADELGIGNFELVVAVGGHVQHWWRDNSALASEPPKEQSAGRDVLVPIDDIEQHQRAVVAAQRSRVAGELRHMLDEGPVISDAARAAVGAAVMQPVDIGLIVERQTPSRWHHAATFGDNVKHAWGLVEGSFGFNLEAILETNDGNLEHWFRDGDGWHLGTTIDA